MADYTDPSTRAREAFARKTVGTLWVGHPPQENVIGRVLAYRLGTLDGGYDPEQDGICLAQDSQAGKSATMKRVRHELAAERDLLGLAPNPYQMVIVGLDQKTSLKSVLQDILIEMKDPDWDYGTEKQLRERIRKFVGRLGVELVVIDECQHLQKGGNDVADVTDALKRFLDLGVAPLVLVGNFDAAKVYDRNPQFRARLGLPLALPALNDKRTADAIHFRNFVKGFDDALTKSDVVKVSPQLVEDDDIIEGLKTVSGGYIGRVARVLKNAAIHAAARGSVTIEPYDLSCITRGYAMPAKWVECDPFSSPTA